MLSNPASDGFSKFGADTNVRTPVEPSIVNLSWSAPPLSENVRLDEASASVAVTVVTAELFSERSMMRSRGRRVLVMAGELSFAFVTAIATPSDVSLRPSFAWTVML